MSEDFGAGPVLSDNFDFEITRSGDIETDSGVAELEKDLAVAVADVTQEFGIGNRFTDSTEEDLRIELGDTITNDPRIDSLDEISFTQSTDDVSLLNVTIRTSVGDGPFDLVIPING